MKNFIVSLSLVLVACNFGSGFRIGPSAPELMSKNGVINLSDNIRATHECGLYMGVRDYAPNEEARAYLCLEGAGYRYPYSAGGGYCQQTYAKDLPACQPGAVIPKPDPAKASPFCQSHPTYPECRP